MQFLVLGYDGSDEQAAERRAAAREAHLSLIGEMKDAGSVLIAAMIKNDEGRGIGSALICEFDSRDELDEWLRREPYVTGGVWENIEVRPCELGPAFR